MPNTIISPTLFAKEVIRNRDKKNVLMKYVNTDYTGELKQAGDTVTVQILPTLTMTPKAITGAGSGKVGTGPGGSITATDFTIKSESLLINKYDEIRIQLRNIEKTQSNLVLTQKIASRMAEAEASMMDNFVRDIVLTDQLADIPTANKLNTSAVAASKANIVEEIEKMIAALDEQNVHDERVLFVPPKIASLYRQANIFDASDDGLKQRQKGYLGHYAGVEIVSTNALIGKNKVIMMAKNAINVVVQITKTKVTDGTDGFYENVMATVVFGGKIFSENAKAICVSGLK